MCNTFTNINSESAHNPITKYRLADFFNAHWNAYCKHPAHAIREEEYRAVNAMRVCRTAALGKRVYACPECGDITEAYHSCKHRFCPHCSWSDTLRWAEKVNARLFQLPHHHVVATVPHTFNFLLSQNYRLLNAALMRSAAYTLTEWMQAKYDVKPGIISVLHTFGEQKTAHHHAHMIVSSGGLLRKSTTIKSIAMDFIPYTFLSRKFRHKFEEYIVEAYDNKTLIHSFGTRSELLSFLKKSNIHDWRFHFEPPMLETQMVIQYIGRYSKRACLSEYKITDINEEYLSFRYKDYHDRDTNHKAKEKIITLHYTEFFPRLLQHVPPKGFQIVRYYGLYATKLKAAQYTQEAKPERKHRTVDTHTQHPRYCKHCGCEKELQYIIFDTRKPNQRHGTFDENKHTHLIISALKSA